MYKHGRPSWPREKYGFAYCPRLTLWSAQGTREETLARVRFALDIDVGTFVRNVADGGWDGRGVGVSV